METGKVSGYMTDFPSEAILGKPGIVCTPHLGASTPEAEDNCCLLYTSRSWCCGSDAPQDS